MSLTFITGNKNKFAEAKALLPDCVRVDIDVPEVQSLDPREVILDKVARIAKGFDQPFFCEDVSLVIPSLNNFPGPLVKFALQSLGTEGIVQLVQGKDPSAQAVCMIGYFDGVNAHIFEGVVSGSLVKPTGSSFGFDPIFLPNGFDKTFDQMSLEEKNACSHRFHALMKLKHFLDSCSSSNRTLFT